MNNARSDRSWLKEAILLVLTLVFCSLVARVESAGGKTDAPTAPLSYEWFGSNHGARP